jgi:hypothetical protein
MLHAIWSDIATRFFFYFSFFSATVTHLTSTVDLTALHLSGGPRPSGRPGASNTLSNVVPLSLLHHALDFLLAQPAAAVSDCDAVPPPTGHLLGHHVQDSVRVDVEGDINR